MTRLGLMHIWAQGGEPADVHDMTRGGLHTVGGPPLAESGRNGNADQARTRTTN